VSIPGAGLDVDLAAGEEIRIEISSKFRPEGIRTELAAAGFRVAQTWTDSAGDYALTLATREHLPHPR
jgi:L-histidine N-alpha-methyltransferase